MLNGPEDQSGSTSFQDGHACAQAELQSGHPGYFYVPGDGSFIDALEATTGLPVLRYGDALRPGALGWIRGFNAGASDFIRRNGLPWNSRLSSITALADIPAWFNLQCATQSPVRLTVNAPARVLPGTGIALSLVDSPGRTGRNKPLLVLTTDRLYVGGFGGAYRVGRTTASENLGTGAPADRLSAGTRQLPLPGGGVESIDFFWGPPESRLGYFRIKATLFPCDRPSGPGEHYYALDLELADWLRSGLRQIHQPQTPPPKPIATQSG